MKENYKIPIGAALGVFVVKLLFLFTHHIQEDAFITWRVAQNFLDYGVMGFNGDTKISASTTHMYVLVSTVFNALFGKENFIYPLLIFNSLLFTIGTYWLSKLLFTNVKNQAWFIVLFSLLPPSIKISILGMEYGLLFFLEIALLYFGLFKNKNWALILFPILILFTRIDTAIFLGLTFIIDLLWSRKIRWSFMLGGILGIVVAIGFNYLYFGEIVNNTIVAKQLRYEKTYTFAQNLEIFAKNLGNFWGMIKVPGDFNPITVLILVFEFLALIYLLKTKNSRNRFLFILFVFGWVKQIIFLSQKSLFDWYYWVPQIVLFIPILVLVLEQKAKRVWWLSLLIVFYILPMIAFQTVHSIATGNGEWNYRRSIGLFLDQHEKNKNEWIFLEPAGYVPYFSKLKTIDEVGLVDHGVQKEIIADRENYWINTVKNRKPKYLLSYKDLYLDKEADYYKQHYKVLKEFRINEHLDSENAILQKIYHLKPSGTDYNLYERRD